MNPQLPPGPFAVGEFHVEPDTGVLRGTTGSARLDPRVMAVLVAFAQNPRALITKQFLIDQVWQGAAVSNDAVTVAIYELRKALGDSAKNPSYIETIPRRGYRLLAEVKSSPSPSVGRSDRLRVAGFSLRSMGIAVPTVAAIAVAAGIWIGGGQPETPPSLVAVLPFELHSTSGDDDYLASGMAETMTSDLARVDGLSVIAHHSVRDVVSPQDPRLAELGATHIVSGSLIRQADELRVNVHVSRLDSTSYTWSETYLGTTAEVLSLQRQVAVSIASRLDHELTASSSGIRRSVPERAMQSYLLGRFFWNERDPESVSRAVALFEESIAADPDFALAWSGLADAYVFPGPDLLGVDRDVGYRRALDASEKAMALDPGLAEAYVSAGAIHFVYERNFARAEEQFRRALALAPSLALGHQWYGELLSARGDHRLAIAHMSEAARLDPRSPSVLFDLFWVQFMAGDFAASLASLEATIRADAADGEVNPLLFWSEARVYAQLDRMDDALASLDRFYQATSSPRPVEVEWLRSHPDRHSFGLFRIRALEKEAQRGRAFPLSLASAYAAAGQVEPALRWLERAVDEHDAASLWIAVSPELQSLRDDPRFVSLVERLGLAEILEKQGPSGRPRASRGPNRELITSS